MIKPDFETTFALLRQRLTEIDYLSKSTLLGAEIQGKELMTFRDFEASGPLSGYFVENTKKTIGGTFGGNIATLEARCIHLKGVLHTDDDVKPSSQYLKGEWR
jgi:hypothetical protein